MAGLDSKLFSKNKKSKKASTSPNSYTTLLIVDVDKTESLNVNTKLLKSIKPIVIVSTATLFTCIALVVVLIGLNVSKDLQVRQSKKAELKAYEIAKEAELKAQQETLNLQKKVEQLQAQSSKEVQEKLETLEATGQTVDTLQNYLKNRGIKLPKELQDADSTSSNQISSLQSSNQIDHLHNDGDIDLKSHQGGAIIDNIDHMENYSKKIEVLNKMARNVPIGLPHTGELSSRFGPRSNPFGGRSTEYHHGLDFKGTTGQPIRTTADGEVIVAGRLGGYGKAVKIKHGYNFITLYGHLSAINVKVGQKVKAGDVIGKLGSTGRSTGPHLHYEVRQGSDFMDPESFISLNAALKKK